jgi:hypothetical protein
MRPGGRMVCYALSSGGVSESRPQHVTVGFGRSFLNQHGSQSLEQILGRILAHRTSRDRYFEKGRSLQISCKGTKPCGLAGQSLFSRCRVP